MELGLKRLLIANRGEIAVRIARTAAELELETVAIASRDDLASLHAGRADRLIELPGKGVAAYLDIDAVVAAALAAGCDSLHPGYGFLAENAELARRCAAAGIRFVGPSPETLDDFGDKTRARALAAAHDVPTPRGLAHAVSLDEAKAFFRELGDDAAIVLKAVAGGGGRGIRIVRDPGELAAAFERCQSEARAAFGDGQEVAHIWERECSLQRRRQKVVEVAPASFLPGPLRERLLADAVRLARATRYLGLGTFEFLVWKTAAGLDYAFIEANPRIQVEHTVTEAVTGLDLVAAQLRVVGGASLGEIGLDQAGVPAPRGVAIQARVNLERMGADGEVYPTGGGLTAFEPPAGLGVRTDSYGYAGYATNPRFDSLLAKVIAHSPAGGFAGAARKLVRALAEFRIAGVETNLAFLRALMTHPTVLADEVDTQFIDEHQEALVAAAVAAPRLYPDIASPGTAATAQTAAPEGVGTAVASPLQGTIVSILVAPGDAVPAGAEIAVLEAMKMEHVVRASVGGIVTGIAVEAGQTVMDGRPLLWIEEGEVAAGEALAGLEDDPDRVSPDLREVLDRHAIVLDEARPDAVAKRRKRNQMMAREMIGRLCDPDSFVEYGPLAVAPRRGRETLPDLIKTTPADGLIAGFGAINGETFGEAAARCAVLAYDATVLAGTQGGEGHRKDSRVFQLAEKWGTPVVFFTEGGGGRPGDTERHGESMSFNHFARLSGCVPLVGVTSGYCFAGNAAFLGCCHVIIATRGSNIGMGGPAMVEGGGLGAFEAREIGPSEVQYRNGVIDLLAEDEAEAVDLAKTYLAFFQGRTRPGAVPDQRRLRQIVPQDRRRAYDMHAVVETLVDEGSLLELRAGFGHGMITALARIEGQPIGIIANNPMHLAGAIDGDGADKAARFMQLCDNFGVPLLQLCDTPGIMVGPESEKTALVRRSAQMLVVAANLRVASFTVIVRKAYGLGMIAMAGGAFKAQDFTIAWPSGELGSMGLEGAVKLGYRKELDAIADPAERKKTYDAMVERMYRRGKVLRSATVYDFDDVIDPADTRRWVVHALRLSAGAPPPPKLPFVSVR
jgi:acetyl-CoA carboxylase carboxyltransferase component/biotin carboxylase